MDRADHDGAGAFSGAALWREDVGVAEGAPRAGRFGDVFASEQPPPQAADDAAPGARGIMVISLRARLLDGLDSLIAEAAVHVGADAREVLEFELVQGVGELRVLDDGEAIGFLHVSADLGEEAVGRDADGAAEGFAQAFVDGLLDALGDVGGALGRHSCSVPIRRQEYSSIEQTLSTGMMVSMALRMAWWVST